ncbi:phosphatase PAP2 family protein [Cryobacterium sp. PAMC25264]|nr:phosphatase PAP2 family protein [Cryobacterium sp. PAMC25264]
MRTILLLGVPWVLADVVKVIVQRLRPDAGLMQHPVAVDPTTYSYPSGHTAFAAALATTVVVLVARRLDRCGRGGVGDRSGDRVVTGVSRGALPHGCGRLDSACARDRRGCV